MKKTLIINKKEIEFKVISKKGGQVLFLLGDKEYQIKNAGMVNRNLAIMINDKQYEIPHSKDTTGNTHLNIGHKSFIVEEKKILRSKAKNVGHASMKSPMPGKVLKILVKPGQVVSAHEPLIVMEAMKMEHTIRAIENGTIGKLYFNEGDMVEGNVDLIEFLDAVTP